MKSTKLSRCTFRVPLVPINNAKNAIEFCFGGQALEMLRAPLVTILRNAIEFFRSGPSFGDVGSAASYDIGVRNAIQTSNAKGSLNRRENNSSNNNERCWLVY